MNSIFQYLYDRTVLNYYRAQIMRAYYRRDFKAFENYLSKIEKHDTAFARFCRLFARQYLHADVTVGEWQDWLKTAGNLHPYIQSRGMMELVTRYLHEGNVAAAIESFKAKCSKFELAPSDINACTGILNFLVKANHIQEAKAFRAYIAQQLHGKNFEESVNLKLMEVGFQLDQDPGQRSKKAFEKFKATNLFRTQRNFFERVEQTYALIEKNHPLLLDIRTDAAEQARLQEFISDHLRNKRPMQLLRLGDGESYGFEPRGVNPILFNYDRNAREMKWWGAHLSSELRVKIQSEFQASLYQSDVVGVPNIFRFFRDFFKQTITSKFGLGVISQITQRGLIVLMEQLRYDLEQGNFPQQTWFVEHRCHQVLFTAEKIRALVSLADKTVIVSQYPENLIQNLFPGAHIQVIQIPAERVSKPLPYQLPDLVKAVDTASGPATLVLVSAGFAGKFLLKVARDKGAVALDVGAMADYWVGRKTRQVSDIV